MGFQEYWVLYCPGSSRVLGPLGSWVLKGSGSSRVLGLQRSSRILGPYFTVCPTESVSKESYLITFMTFSIDAIYQYYPQFQFPADTMS